MMAAAVRFGYSVDRAETIKNQIDRDLGKIENRVRYLQQAVPNAGAITARADGPLEELREIAGDLQGLVDERTDSSEGPS